MYGRQFLTVAAALSLGFSSARAACTRSYTVKSGDNCNAIAVAQGVSLYQITFVNAANACNNLQIGQSLCLATDTYNCQPVYTVKSGDTCTNIATSHGISLSQFLADNPNLDPSTCPIQIGMSVCVSTTTPGSTTTATPTTTSTTAAPTTTGCTRTYTVKSGDNCNAIAVAQGVSLYQLQLLNIANACNNLQIGQVLCLASTSYNCQPVYTVQSDDTCSNIATSHGISLATFLADNPNLDPSTCPLQVGLSVCVSPNTPGTPTSTTTATTTTTSTSSTPTSTACTKFGTVQPGDSCEAIAQRDKISTYFLQLINPPNTCANLIAGASICIDSPLNNCSSVYTVTGSEGGCANIATSNKITVDELYALNPNVNSPSCNNIFPGEVLCVAPRASTPPPSNDCTREATIVIGDTCTNFAARASLTNLQLAGLNPSLNCNALIPGKTLCTFSAATSICPGLVKVAVNDTCFSLAQKVHMSLDEWEGLNVGIICDALLPGSVVCSAEGNATLPSQPSGTNPTALPLCGNYDKKTNCCTQWSVSADLHSDLCERANGCQENCVGDSTVTVPPSAGTPTTVIVTTDYPLPTPPPNSGCDSCTSSQCCTLGNVCQDIESWFCESAHGCVSNCDKGPAPGVNLPWQAVLADANYTFPSGDYSATGGNPCGVCNADNALAPSPNGQYCCSQDIQCVPVGFTDCLVSLGCTYNCIEVNVDYDACEDGTCTPSTTTVLRPFAT
ncbi:hypothetical protein AURDEDRAFT_114630 [Auricularia subglabra TFB-10046 SS5]|nr:hypothetical protein AURDEDRAFT_114630 [Auricularia subglabra TFB-10046 SS5]